MQLNKYFLNFPRNQRTREAARVAQALGVTPAYIYMMRCGRKRIPEWFAVPLEHATRGMVRREESCPHLYKY